VAREYQDVTDTELAIMQVCWEKSPVTRRQIADVLYPGGGPAQYATVQKLLQRLEDKGFVTHEKEGLQLFFRPAVPREELINRRLQDVADKLCGGSLTPLLMNLVRARSVSPQELDALRQLVKNLRKQEADRDEPQR
jgi:BlaI family transcriptional regulator, penicillinase repressor